MHGGQGHSGRSKGDHSASQSVAPSAQVQRSAPAVRPAAGGGILGSPRLSALFEALGPIRTQRLSDHIVGLPAVFQLGDPGWPEGRRPEGGLRKGKGEPPDLKVNSCIWGGGQWLPADSGPMTLLLSRADSAHLQAGKPQRAGGADGPCSLVPAAL